MPRLLVIRPDIRTPIEVIPYSGEFPFERMRAEYLEGAYAGQLVVTISGKEFNAYVDDEGKLSHKTLEYNARASVLELFGRAVVGNMVVDLGAE